VRYRFGSMKLGFFNAAQVCRLAKISEVQLRYWNKTKVFQPQTLEGAGPYRRVYSFRDVVGLKTISILRNKYHVDLKDIRLIEDKLKDTSIDWPALTFYVGEDRRIYFRDPQSGETIATHPMGQRPLFRMRAIARGIERTLAHMQKRTVKEIGKIDQNRYVLHNASVVAGTRVPTSAIYGFHKAGYTEQEIVKQYPRLTPDDVKAAIEYEGLKLKKAAS
jgi:uncharacterized protein (DUF433 family)